MATAVPDPYAAEATGLPATVLVGTVKAVDLAAATVIVASGEIETAPIAWGAARAGDTRSWSPPTVGEQLVLILPEGDIARAIPVAALWQDAHPAPGDSLRELTLYRDGAELAYDPERHELEARLPAGATVTIIAAGGVTIDAGQGGVAITGDVEIDGKLTVSDDVTASGEVTAKDRVKLSTHRHLGVTTGSGTSGPPA